MLIRQEEMQRQEDLQAIEIELKRQRQQIAKGKKNVQKYRICKEAFKAFTPCWPISSFFENKA